MEHSSAPITFPFDHLLSLWTSFSSLSHFTSYCFFFKKTEKRFMCVWCVCWIENSTFRYSQQQQQQQHCYLKDKRIASLCSTFSCLTQVARWDEKERGDETKLCGCSTHSAWNSAKHVNRVKNKEKTVKNYRWKRDGQWNQVLRWSGQMRYITDDWCESRK